MGWDGIYSLFLLMIQKKKIEFKFGGNDLNCLIIFNACPGFRSNLLIPFLSISLFHHRHLIIVLVKEKLIVSSVCFFSSINSTKQN